MILKGLSRENNELIGFVVSSLFASAIRLDEMRTWTLYMIEKHDIDELPLYIFDLMDYDDDLYKIDGVIGFVSGWKHTKADGLALEGIAIARGFDPYETLAPKEVLLQKLQMRPNVLQRFKETFPFIDVSGVKNKLFGG